MQTLLVFLLARSFILQVPASPLIEPLPLVIAFNGHGGTADGMKEYFSFDQRAIFAYPSGIDGAWDADFCCADRPIDDVGFVENMVAYISSLYPVDPDRIYAIGSSNGGMLCHKLAAQLSHRFAAIVDISGAVGSPTLHPYGMTQRVSIMMLHGTNDPVVPYNGDNYYMSFNDGVKFWKEAFHYTR